MSIEALKKELRREMLTKREAYSLEKKKEYDSWLCNVLGELVDQNDFRTIHCYIPMGSEIDIIPWIEKLLASGRLVVTPKTLRNRKLQHLVLESLDQLEEGLFKTWHPSGENEYSGTYDLIIVPGLAFDKSHYRLGYGGGYYDGFLSENSRAYKLGIFYPFQEVPQVPLESHDIKLDRILVKAD